MTTHTHKIGFLGAGNMATALAQGFISGKLAKPEETYFYDVVSEKSRELAHRLGGHSAKTIRPLMQSCETIILAVKPQNARELLPEVAPWAGPKHLFISILAGTPTRKIEPHIGGQPRVVRVMPNTPALVGAGASAIARGSHATQADVEVALALFRSVGVAVEVEEAQIDAVTAISGSGPAYFFYLMEALMSAGEELGLDPEIARKLVLQTALGAATLADQSPDTPATLRANVTSKGGTTEAGIKVLSSGGFSELVLSCAKAAAERAEQLSKSA